MNYQTEYFEECYQDYLEQGYSDKDAQRLAIADVGIENWRDDI